MTDARPGRPARLVVIGGGFAGLWAVRALRAAPVEILLIDRHNHHVFQPLLYQVATASLTPSDVAYPIRVVLSGQLTAFLRVRWGLLKVRGDSDRHFLCVIIPLSE